MALSKTVNYKGMEVQGCYIKVLCFEGSKKGMSVCLSYHADKDSPKLFTEWQSVVFDPLAGNYIEQAYKYLKTLPAFNDATDVLEE